MAYNPFNPWQNQPSDMGASMQDLLLRQQQRSMAQQQAGSKAQNTMYEIGRLISMRRNSMGLSHEQLSELSGVSGFEVMQIEFGNSNYTSIEKLFRVTAALRLELNVFPF